MRPLASSVSTVLLYRPAFSRLSRSRPRSTAYSPAKVGLSSSSWTGTGTRNATQTARPRQTTWRRTQVWWRAGGTRSVSDVAMGAARGAGAGRHEERARRSPGGVLRSRRCQQASIARGSTLGLFGRRGSQVLRRALVGTLRRPAHGAPCDGDLLLAPKTTGIHAQNLFFAGTWGEHRGDPGRGFHQANCAHVTAQSLLEYGVWLKLSTDSSFHRRNIERAR